MADGGAARTDEDHRRECEARNWIRQGYFTANRVEELMQRIERHRGREAAASLREEMRRQWMRREEWLVDGEPDAQTG